MKFQVVVVIFLLIEILHAQSISSSLSNPSSKSIPSSPSSESKKSTNFSSPSRDSKEKSSSPSASNSESSARAEQSSTFESSTSSDPSSEPSWSYDTSTTCGPCHVVNFPEKLCETYQNPGSCECHVDCCDLPKCEFGIDWTFCDSCQSCQCLLQSSDSSPSQKCSEPCPSTNERLCYMERDENCDCVKRCPSFTYDTSAPPCPESCGPTDNIFCEPVQDPGTCECELNCCDPPVCEFGINYELCYGCNNCSCLEGPSASPSNDCSAPCPSHQNRFCWYARNQLCECEERCCSLPYCEYGVDFGRCSDCFNCQCLPPPSSESPSSDISSSPSCGEPCEQPDDKFCYAVQDESTCECHVACRSLPFCEFGINWEQCHSCKDCPCVQKNSSSSPPCPETCQQPEDRFCEVIQDSETCECREKCCDHPQCEFGINWDQCRGCDDCFCLSPPSSPSPDCNMPCPSDHGPFCYWKRIQGCECERYCCEAPDCGGVGVDWQHCYDCFNCPCLASSASPSDDSSVESPSDDSSSYDPPSPSPNCTEACPCSDKRFCDFVQEENCDCTEICCEPPTCEGLGVDWKNCESCSNCPCLPPASSCESESSSPPSPSPDCNAPCPSTGSNFCYGIRDDWCVCQTVCCAPPDCPGTGVDWPNCTSCSHCPCLPPSPPSHDCDHD